MSEARALNSVPESASDLEKRTLSLALERVSSQIVKLGQSSEDELRPILRSMARESRKIYREENVTVCASFENGSMFGQCLEISSTGLSFLKSSKEHFEVAPAQQIAVTVTSPQGKSSVIKAEVKTVTPFASQQENDAWVVFAEFNDDFPSELHLSNMRGSPMITLPVRYQPQATSGDPLFSTGYILYRVEALTNKGARLHTCGRGVPLLPGFELQLRLLLPNSGDVNMHARILKVTPDPIEEGFLVEVLFLDLNPDHEAALAEHLLFARPSLSFKEMKNSGFFVDSARKALRVSFCNSESDWISVLQLRLQAYQAVGKFLEKKSAHEMQDRFDSYARQLIVKSGEKVVGAARVVFVDKQRDRSEHVALGIKVPDELFKTSFVEASRGCTDPSYRGDDVFLMLIQKGFEACIQTSHDAILTNCNPEMWPLYKKIGYRKLGVRFSGFGRDDCELIAVYPREILFGQASSVLHWGYLWSDAVKNILKNPSSQVTLADKIRAFLPIALQKIISKPVEKRRRLGKYRALRNKHKSVR